MKAPEKPADEDARLEALRAHRLLDTPPEQELDDLVRIAASLLDTPIALISLLDETRQWFKARYGLDAPETPRDVSFCGHAILDPQTFVIPDSHRDTRFADNPLVTGEPHVRFYAGAPLITRDGHALGTLCVIDTEPRTIEPEGIELLEALGRQVVRQLELRRHLMQTTAEANHAKARVVELEREAAGSFSHREASQFFRLNLDMLCIASFEGEFLRLNPAWERVLGWSMDELVGAPFMPLIHPDDLERTAAETGKLREGGHETVAFDVRFRCEDGSYRWLRWTATVNLEQQRYYAVARDVTLEKQAMSQLANTASRMRSIVSTATDAIITVDSAGTIQSFNIAASRIFGYEPAEVIGRSVSVLMSSQEARQVGPRREVEGRRRDGSTFPIELAVSQVDLDEGVLFTGIVRDISERKVIEQLKNEFVSTVSHELRTPLTSISGSLRLIEGGIVGEIPEEASELITIASANAQRLIRLINDILDLEKIESDTFTPRTERLELDTVIERSIDGMKGLASEAGVRLTTELLPLPTINGDADRLVQVLTNLLSNAIKFSPGQGEVVVRARRDGDDVRVEVVDNGPGLAPHECDRIFEKFHQVDGSDSRKKGGTGLGLAISRAIVERHGGVIGVISTLGNGSRFWFTLPVRNPEATAQVEADPHTILLVEDNDDLRAILRSALLNEGYAVEEANSLAVARDRVEAAHPHAILLDLELPDGNGLELVEQLRSDPHTSDIPVVVLTATEQPGSPNAAVMDWLVKPMEHERLFRAVRRAVRPPGTARVLVVEDDDMLRRLVTNQVERLGVTCFEAADGKSAIELTNRINPDLIVLDVGLPRLDGFDVVELLRQGRFAATPLVILTNRDLSESDRRALRLGVTRHLMKAHTHEDEFLGVVRDLLDGLVAPSTP